MIVILLRKSPGKQVAVVHDFLTDPWNTSEILGKEDANALLLHELFGFAEFSLDAINISSSEKCCMGYAKYNGFKNQAKEEITQDYGNCPLYGREKTAGKTTFTVDLKFGVVVIREVPALVCDQCGEAWFEDNVAEQLEQIILEAWINTL